MKTLQKGIINVIQLKSIILMLIFLTIFLSGCKQVIFCTHKLAYENYERPIEMEKLIIRDLNSDGKDEIILIRKNQEHSYITIHDEKMNIISQLNYYSEIANVNTCNIDDDEDKELFICNVVDSNYVYLAESNYEWEKELIRTDFTFQPITRIDISRKIKRLHWHPSLVPNFADDLYKNGEKEMIVTANAGFSCYPRGVWIYDVHTGKELWNYQTAGNITSLLFEDFDGDGEKEFIISTYSFKNHKRIVNGTDDFHSYIIVFDTKGKTLYREKTGEGYSAIYSKAVDINGDGTKEIISKKVTWGNNKEKNGLYIRKWENGTLNIIKKKEFEASFARSGGFENADINNDGKDELLIVGSNNDLLVFDLNLNILENFTKIPVNAIKSIEDLDLDGEKEILLYAKEGGLLILNSKMKIKTYFQKHLVGKNKINTQIFNVGFGNPQKIIISPGPATPNDAGICLDVIKEFAADTPIFGICLGHQAIAQVFGGEVIRAKNMMHGKTSQIKVIKEDILFNDLPNEFTQTRYHSLTVNQDNLPL